MFLFNICDKAEAINHKSHTTFPEKNYIEISISEDGFVAPYQVFSIHCSVLHRIRDISYQDPPSPSLSLSCIHLFRNDLIQTRHEKYEAIKVDDTSLIFGLIV